MNVFLYLPESMAEVLPKHPVFVSIFYNDILCKEVIKLLNQNVVVYLSSKENHNNNHSRCFSLDLFLRAFSNAS